MGASDERELRGCEIDVMDFVEAYAGEIDAVQRSGDEAAYRSALSFARFKTAWTTRRFSNVHLGKPAQWTYNGYVQCACDCALKYARTGKTLATRAVGAYVMYALHETQLEGESVRVYASPEMLVSLAALSDECAGIGVLGVGLALAKLMREESFVCGVRDVTAIPASRMGSGAPEVFKDFDETVAMQEALGHLLQGQMDQELEMMRTSASEYTSALALATHLDETSAAAPVTICSTVDTLLRKTRTKVENALKPPIDAAETTLLLPNVTPRPAADLVSMPRFT